MAAELYKGINRRDFLRCGTAALISVGACTLDMSIDNGEDLLRREINGDAVFHALPGIPVTIRGWTISIPHDALRRSTSDNSDKVSIALTNRDENRFTNITSQNGIILVNDKDVSKSGLDNVRWRYFFPTEQPFLLLASRYSAGKSLTREFNIKLKSYHENYPENTKPFVFSEAPLPQETLDRLADISRRFYPYTGYIPTNINNNDFEGGQYYNIRVKKVLIDGGSFKGSGLISELDPDYGFKTQFHELNHALFENLESCSSGKLFKNAFDTLYSVSGLDRRNNEIQQEAEKSALWNIVDESTYALQKKENLSDEDREEVQALGHPYDNERELFASTMTVLRYYSPEFLVRYRNLPNSDNQKAIRDLVSLTLRQVRSMSREENFERLLPHNELIIQSLKLN